MGDVKITNPVASGINTGIKIVGEGVTAVVLSFAISELPFLGLPVIRQIFSALLNWIAGLFEKALETGATFTVINIQTGMEEKEMSQALKNLMDAEKSGDQQRIKDAILVYQKAQSDLIHFDGSAPPQ